MLADANQNQGAPSAVSVAMSILQLDGHGCFMVARAATVLDDIVDKLGAELSTKRRHRHHVRRRIHDIVRTAPSLRTSKATSLLRLPWSVASWASSPPPGTCVRQCGSECRLVPHRELAAGIHSCRVALCSCVVLGMATDSPPPLAIVPMPGAGAMGVANAYGHDRHKGVADASIELGLIGSNSCLTDY